VEKIRAKVESRKKDRLRRVKNTWELLIVLSTLFLLNNCPFFSVSNEYRLYLLDLIAYFEFRIRGND